MRTQAHSDRVLVSRSYRYKALCLSVLVLTMSACEEDTTLSSTDVEQELDATSNGQTGEQPEHKPRVVDGSESSVTSGAMPAGPRKPKAPKPTMTSRGLMISVSEASAAQTTLPVRAKSADATRLSESDTQSLLRRLPALKSENLSPSFNFRERSKPAPRAGTTVNGEFPPAQVSDVDRPNTQAAALEVLRYSPEGEVPIAPKLSITFSQPMVEVTSHDELKAKTPPVTLTPPVDGEWRWIGTRTLLFEAQTRFKMATDYSVEVPAGTKSVTGGSLASAVKWSFQTPPPVLKSSHPNGGPHNRRPLLYAKFDQAIVPEEVLKHVRVSAGQKTFAVQMASSAELESTTVGAMMNPGENDLRTERQLAFRTVEELPQNTTVTVAFSAGLPSAEGSRTATSEQSFSFQTYGPFELRRSRCGWRDNCPPLNPFSIEMSNAFDAEVFKPSQVTVSPKIEGLNVDVSGRWLTLRGMTKGRTTYEVTLSRDIKDRFGQALGKDVRVSFRVTDAAPLITAQGGDFIVLDPAAKRKTFQISSINHDEVLVNLYRVEPADWGTWQTFLSGASKVKNRPDAPGRRVFSETIQIASRRDELVHTHIDLSSALKDNLGHVVVEIEPVKQRGTRWREVIVAWVQSTQIGLDVFRDSTDLHAWATSLTTGEVLKNVRIRSLPKRFMGTTDSRGLVSMALAGTAPSGREVLIAELGEDIALLPESTSRWSSRSSWREMPSNPTLRWFVFDDRKLYKPKETVSVKGWIRQISGGKTPMVGSLDGSTKDLTWVLKDSRNNDVQKGTALLNGAGGFDFKIQLTDTMNLGAARLMLSATTDIGGRTHTHYLRVEEFRRPEFEVKTTPSSGPHLVGGRATVGVKATYFAGGPLPDAEVRWTVRSSLSSYTPPNRSEYTFGSWTPWWESPPSNRDAADSTYVTGRTDSSGEHIIGVDFQAVNPPRAATVVADATVQDVNRQTFSSSTALLVHPADHYVGMKSKRAFIKAGETLKLELVVVDIDGKAVVGRPIEVQATRTEWVLRKGSWKREDKETETCELTSGDNPVQCKVTLKKGGQWRVTAVITDHAGRKNQTRRNFWVSGGKQPVSRKVKMEKVTLIPSQSEYKPGDIAEILVQSPFVPAEGIMSVRVGGIVELKHFKMTESTTTLQVPIAPEYVPDVRIKVDLAGVAPRMDRNGEPIEGAPSRPAFAAGQIGLKVPPYQKTLDVTVMPSADKVDPGASMTVDVLVKDAQGNSVPNAEVALVMVDEAVLALTGYRIPDPVSMFYTIRGYIGRDQYLRSSVLLVDPDLLPKIESPPKPRSARKSMKFGAKSSTAAPPLPMAAMPMDEEESDGGGDKKDAGSSAIGVRKNFDALAAFSPVLQTDGEGKVSLPVTLPDNLSRYRITAVVVDGGTKFGKGESTVTARLPLMVRPSAPRFLNFGDRFELPIVLQNQTDEALSVDVVVQSLAVQMTEGQGRRLTVPANDRVEVRFPAAVEDVGTARFQIGVAAGSFADAAMIELPVYTPATTEAFATYGVLDGKAVVQPVRAPGDVVPQFGGLEVTTSSTALQALTDAVLYLTSYPYECAEQVSSRIMAIASLRDVLSAFEADGLPSPAEMLASVDRDMKKLAGLQHVDGGFGFWKRSDSSWPYLSVHVAHALVRAKQKGFEVPQRMLSRSLSYLRDIERKFPRWYGAAARRTITSYALYVRQLHGDRDPAKAKSLIAAWGGVDKTPLEPIGWLLSVLSADPGSVEVVAAIRKHLSNRVTETAGNAHWVTSYKDGAHLLLHSSRRADGILLEAIIGDQPKSDLIPKVVRGLLAHRKNGRWGNTQENAFVLLALDRYFNTYEKQTPDFVARVWLGDGYAGEHKFKGRTTERHRIDIPMSVLASQPGRQPLTIGKDGQGRMYYRIGMSYAPSSLKLDAADHGFTVLRRYEGVDDKEDVIRRADGTWEVKAGARVRVVLTMVAEARRYHVALVDQLPAGLEPMNPALKGTQAAPPSIPGSSRRGGRASYGRYSRWWGPWFEHQNLRDERAEAFTSLLWGGVHTYSYVARATTPGQFVVPPAKAEEMYAPETFGRSATARLDVVIR